MRWSNSPEIGLSSSFGHLFTPIEFFSPLTSAKHKVHLVEKSSYTHPFYHQVIFNKAMRTTINFYLVNLTVADLMVTAWGPFHRYFEYFPRKTDGASHLWKTVDQSALCSLMKELSRKTDGADGEYFLPGEIRGDF